MSALAILCKNMGKVVSGSDLHFNDCFNKLKTKKIKCFVGHSTKHITKSVDLVVMTGAIKEDNCELIKARANAIRVMERSQFLGAIASLYENVISIAGTHGKTTTCAMIAHIFLKAGKFPTVHLGGESKEFGNLFIGGRDYFITEACEYRNSFQFLKSHTALITNIEKDHLDFFKSYKQIEMAFLQFAENATENVVLYNNKKFANKINIDLSVFSCGLNNSFDFYAYDIQEKGLGFSFKANYKTEKIGDFKINMLGKHNVFNSICAIAVAHLYGVDSEVIENALRDFSGVKRRYEVLGGEKFPVIADYAHHPTEIKNSLLGLKNHCDNILCIFQPHLFSRTKLLMQQFQSSFCDADELLIFKTYPAREVYDSEGDEKALFSYVLHNNSKLVLTKRQLKKEIINANKKGYTTLILGAGDIYDIVKKLLKKCGKLY